MINLLVGDGCQQEEEQTEEQGLVPVAHPDLLLYDCSWRHHFGRVCNHGLCACVSSHFRCKLNLSFLVGLDLGDKSGDDGFGLVHLTLASCQSAEKGAVLAF